MNARKYQLSVCLFPLILFIFGNAEIFAQVPDTDSLTKVAATQYDSPEKVETLFQISRGFFLRSQFDSAYHYSTRALELSVKIGFSAGEGDAYYMQSNIMRVRTDFKNALSLAEKYLEIYSRLEDSVRLAKGWYNLGLMNKETGNAELAIHYCQKSLKVALRENLPTFILGNYQCIGSTYFTYYNNYDSAIRYYLAALDFIDLNRMTGQSPLILSNLGDVYFADGQYEMAKNYYRRSLDLNLAGNQLNNLAIIYSNLGRLAIVEKRFQDALENYQQAMRIYEDLGIKRGMADVFNNLGDLYFKQHNYPLARPHFEKSLLLYREISFLQGKITAMLNLAAVYSETGNIAESRRLQDSCILIAGRLENKKPLLDVYWNIADNYEKINDFASANQYLIKHKNLHDSLFNLERSKTISDLIFKYEKGKDRARILELEKENLQKTNQRNAYLFTGLGILVVTLFVILYLRQKSRHDKIVAGQRIRQLEEEKKLMAARLLVEGQEEERKRIATELHDGLGVLLSATRLQFSTIKDKSPDNREVIEKASRLLEQASNDVRKISHNMMPGLLTKLGFYEAVEDLFEGISDSGDLHARCSIVGPQLRMAENKEIMLYRIIQEMVNNTLKHAHARNATLDISVSREWVEIIFKDDGKGFDFTEKFEAESIGLKSIKSRVEFLGGKLEVDSRPGQGVRYSFRVGI